MPIYEIKFTLNEGCVLGRGWMVWAFRILVELIGDIELFLHFWFPVVVVVRIGCCALYVDIFIVHVVLRLLRLDSRHFLSLFIILAYLYISFLKLKNTQFIMHLINAKLLLQQQVQNLYKRHFTALQIMRHLNDANPSRFKLTKTVRSIFLNKYPI